MVGGLRVRGDREEAAVTTWTRLEGRCAGRGFALQCVGEDTWEVIIDGCVCGRYDGDYAAADAQDAVPFLMAEYPPEHPHPGVDAAAARDDIHLTGRLDGSITEGRQ